MKKSTLSSREIFMIVFLVLLLVGVCYYMFFLTPLNDEIAQINADSAALDEEITTAEAKVASMKSMQEELDAILSQPKDKITEIAPYDNAKVVMNQLNGILSQGLEYDLAFSDPQFDENGLVRRSAQLRFTSSSYENAKAIITDLATNHWRCVISDISVAAADSSLSADQITVQAVITFYENSNLK